MERAKALDAAGRELRKFEGLGRFGAACHARAERLAAHGWSPPPLRPPDGAGFVASAFLAGRPLTATGARGQVARLGRYCADRARLLPADGAAVDGQPALAEMMETNVALELGAERPPRLPELQLQRPVVADGRMQPHEWIETAAGALVKTDATAHGDDHFFPGPTDIAWDMAGVVVECALPLDLRADLLAAYRQASGEDAADRLPAFEIAYAAFRARAALMAAHACPPADALRWRRAHARYHRALRAALARAPSAAR
jgi:hypothetical protein